MTTSKLLTSTLLALLTCGLVFASPSMGQAYIDQFEIEEILERRGESLNSLPEVHYEYKTLDDPRDNTVIARSTFYKQIGDGDTELGQERAQLVELLNRVNMRELSMGDTLVVPTEWNLDFRAYSPFPRYYPGARDHDKLFVIDKSVQAFAAYEYGELKRWGVVNTGDPDDPEMAPTPNGRFNFNWKEEYRISSLSPPDELWEMHWVFNFHDRRGIHIHQYPMPTGGPTSRGCVRLVDADAEWIYNWADAWETTTGTTGIESRQGQIVEQGTMVLVIGEEPEGRPNPFEYKDRYPVLDRVDLPTDPYDVEPGTRQQEVFDERRTASR